MNSLLMVVPQVLGSARDWWTRTSGRPFQLWWASLPQKFSSENNLEDILQPANVVKSVVYLPVCLFVYSGVPHVTITHKVLDLTKQGLPDPCVGPLFSSSTLLVVPYGGQNRKSVQVRTVGEWLVPILRGCFPVLILSYPWHPLF